MFPKLCFPIFITIGCQFVRLPKALHQFYDDFPWVRFKMSRMQVAIFAAHQKWRFIIYPLIYYQWNYGFLTCLFLWSYPYGMPGVIYAWCLMKRLFVASRRCVKLSCIFWWTCQDVQIQKTIFLIIRLMKCCVFQPLSNIFLILW